MWPTLRELRDQLEADFDRSISPGNIFGTQLSFQSAVAIALTALLMTDFEPSGFFLAAGLLSVAATVASVLIPWPPTWSKWAVLIACADILACLGLSAHSPSVGFSALIVLPLIWIATIFGTSVTIVTVTLAVLLLVQAKWVQTQMFGGDFTAAIPHLINVASLVVFSVIATTARTRRARARSALMRSQAEMLERTVTRGMIRDGVVERALNSVDFAVALISRRGTTVFANDNAHTLARAAGTDVNEPTIPLFAYRADRTTPIATEEQPLHRAMRGEIVESAILWFGEPDDDQLAIEFNATPIHDPRGTLHHTLVVARDVTAHLADIGARDEMVTSIQHEFRTPLTSILGYLELALEDDLPDSARRGLVVALNNAERLLELTNDFLAARSSTHRPGLTLHVRPVDLAELLAASIDANRPMAASRLVAMELVPVAPVIVELDPLRMRQVIDNLVMNAIKYNVSGGRVTLSVEHRDGGVALCVADTGRGMSAEEREHVFTRFYRSDAARASSVRGAGLGLNIVQDIVTMHHGHVDIDSEPGTGTTVSVWLPLRKAEA